MKKTTDYQKEFLEVFKKLSYCRSSWDVWKDFLDMGCISMSNSVPALYREDREKEYLSIIGRYKKEEQELFPELFGYFVLALSENPAQDFLGEMYHKLGLEQEQKGRACGKRLSFRERSRLWCRGNADCFCQRIKGAGH